VAEYCFEYLEINSERFFKKFANYSNEILNNSTSAVRKSNFILKLELVK